MKAWILHDTGDIRYEDTDMPQINDDEVLVEVKAAGICGSDIPRIFRDGAHKMPIIPGHEFAGKVTAVGSDADRELMFKRVGVFPLIPCRECEPCQKRMYEMCRDYGYIGSRRNGAFAEYAAVPKANIIQLPDNVSYGAAAMLEPMAVAVHAIRRVKPLPTDKVVVCGLGTIGMFVIMFLRERGIENVYAVGNKDFQRGSVLKMGIPAENYYCGTDAFEWIREKTGGGADVYFECVGKNSTVTQAVNNTAPGGRIVLVGNPETDMFMKKSVYWKILRNQLVVSGTWNSSFTGASNDDWHYVLNKLKDNRINPTCLISHKLNMEQLMDGLTVMRDKTEDYIKVMLINQ